MKTKEELQNKEKLCDFCPLDENEKGVRCYGGSIVMCEGSQCDTAYEVYCEVQKQMSEATK
jgi:hypothetical protein